MKGVNDNDTMKDIITFDNGHYTLFHAVIKWQRQIYRVFL